MPVLLVLRLWGPVLLVMGLIFAASSVPDPAPLPGGLSDKLAHLGVYALLSATIVRALARARLNQVTWVHAAGAVALSVAYGALDELHQMSVPGRTPDWQDLVADMFGASIGAVGLLALRPWLVRRAPRERYTRVD